MRPRVNLRAVNQSQYFDTAEALPRASSCINLHLVIFLLMQLGPEGIPLTRFSYDSSFSFITSIIYLSFLTAIFHYLCALRSVFISQALLSLEKLRRTQKFFPVLSNHIPDITFVVLRIFNDPFSV